MYREWVQDMSEEYYVSLLSREGIQGGTDVGGRNGRLRVET